MELQRVKEIEKQFASGEMAAREAFEAMKQLVYRAAPCRAFCESKAYESKIAKLEQHIDALTLAV